MKTTIITITNNSEVGAETLVFTDRKEAAKKLFRILRTYPIVAEEIGKGLYVDTDYNLATHFLTLASEKEYLQSDTILVQEHEIEVPDPQVGRFVGVLDIPRNSVRLAVRMFIATFCMQGRICVPEHGISTGMPATGAFDEHFFYIEDIANGAGEAEYDNLSQPDRFDLQHLMKQVADAGCWWIRFTE